jgi:DNA-binding MarR family transcriptional regulator
MTKARKDDVERLVRGLYGLGHVRREISRHALAELGTQGFHALGVVHVHGPVRVSDVAKLLGVDVSVASRQVNALISAGYVERSPSPDDRRAWLVSTTDAGHRVLAESHRRMVHSFGEVLADWSPGEVTALAENLERLSEDFARASSSDETQEVGR